MSIDSIQNAVSFLFLDMCFTSAEIVIWTNVVFLWHEYLWNKLADNNAIDTKDD